MSTFSWNTTSNADWNTAADWTRSAGSTAAPPGNTLVPAATDIATITGTTSGSPFTVSIAGGEKFDIATLNYSSTTTSGAPTLSITGTLLMDKLAISGTKTLTTTINPGGVLDIRTSITNASSTAETITVGGTGTGAGGRLEFGSASSSGIGVDQANITYKFSNNSGSASHGDIEYLSGFNSAGTTTNQHISGLAWGDGITFDGANFNGDTFAFAGSTLTVKNGAATVLTMKNLAGTGLSSANFKANGDEIVIVCFAAGTHILTSTGERIVESLMHGDIVLTLSGGELHAQPVKWIGRRRIDLTAHPHPETVAPIRIRRGAFADNMPHTDLVVSPDHAIFVDGKLIAARQLINGTTIAQEKTSTSVEYFHVELDTHAILLAEGLPAESYLNTGNHGFFANSDEPLVLHPDLTDETDYPTREAGSCAPFVWDEALVRPVWQRLSERAAALGQPVRPAETTNDPALHLVAGGRSIKPIYADAGLFIFPLPRNAGAVRLVSRASAPADARPWLDDRRRLGVRLARIVLRDAAEVREISVDHPDLQQGWWAVERDGTAMGRWTDGDAVLPLPAVHGVTMLEIHLHGTLDYVVSEEDRRAA